MPAAVELHRRLALSSAVLALGAVWLVAFDAEAATTPFMDPVAFASALPGPAQVRDFEGVGTPVVPSGGSIGDLVFTYSLSLASLQISDVHDTVSGVAALGLDGVDAALLDGDAVTITLAGPVHAVGLYVVASDAASAGEIQIDTPVGSASTGAAPLFVLADGGHAYFVGLVSDTSFSQIDLGFAPDADVNFTYTVDDVVTAVPEPGVVWGLAEGTLLLRWLGRRRACALPKSSQSEADGTCPLASGRVSRGTGTRRGAAG